MSRIEKILWLKTRFPDVYYSLKKLIPNLIANPGAADDDEISLYNQCISVVFKRIGYGPSLIETLQF